MTAAFGADAPHIFGLLGAPMPSWQALRVAYGAWRARGTGWVAETVRLLVASPREWLDENFESAKLKTMMAIWGMHLDFSPDSRAVRCFLIWNAWPIRPSAWRSDEAAPT